MSNTEDEEADWFERELVSRLGLKRVDIRDLEPIIDAFAGAQIRWDGYPEDRSDAAEYELVNEHRGSDRHFRRDYFHWVPDLHLWRKHKRTLDPQEASRIYDYCGRLGDL